MQVFKLYIKLMKKNSTGFLIYLGVFLGIVIMITANQASTPSSEFTEAKIRLAYINQDEDSLLLDGFKNYIEDKVNFVKIEETEEGMRDALFFRTVEYVLTIPEGFTENFIEGKELKLQKLSVPDSTSSAYMDMNIENYFNTVKLYTEYTDLSMKEVNSQVIEDLEARSHVNMTTGTNDNQGVIKYYFDYVAYALSAILILGISSIMVSMRNIDIKRRNLISPVSVRSVQLQQVLCFFSFTLLLDLLLIVIGMFFSKGIHASFILYSINTIVFSLAMLSIAYLAGIGAKSREASDGIANIVSLGFAFLGGVFVPKEILAGPAITIGRFTPTYWFTTANDFIANTGTDTVDNLQNIFISIGIQLGFALAAFSIALVVNKIKSSGQ